MIHKTVYSSLSAVYAIRTVLCTAADGDVSQMPSVCNGTNKYSTVVPKWYGHILLYKSET